MAKLVNKTQRLLCHKGDSARRLYALGLMNHVNASSKKRRNITVILAQLQTPMCIDTAGISCHYSAIAMVLLSDA